MALLPTTQARSLSGPSGQREEARHALLSVLQKHGYNVMPAEEVSATLDARVPDGCHDAVTCDPELALQVLGTDAVVSLAVWQRPSAAPQVLVYIRRKESFGQAELVVDKAGVASAASRALDQALADTQHRHDVGVRIESEPEQANVRVDQNIVGPSPAVLQLAPGNHLVTVETPGYVTATRFIEVPERSDTPVVHKIVLERTSPPEISGSSPTRSYAGSDTEDPVVRTTRASGANYLIAGMLGAVAVPLLANAIYAGAISGNCKGGARDPQGRCGARATLGATFWTSLVLGSAALASGAVVFIVQPFTGTAERYGATAQLHFHGTF